MSLSRFFLFSLVIFSFSVPALADVNDEIEQKGQYWQRVNSSSALYLRGPKAQQMLTRNIAMCVTELKELERLGVVKDPIPAYANEYVLSEDEAILAGYDAPERDKTLFAEHSNYNDFEGCMLAKGWERVKYVPFDVAEQAHETYLLTHKQYREQTRLKRFEKFGGGVQKDQRGDFDNLNE